MRQGRNTGNGEGESMADEVEGDTVKMEMEGAELEKDVTMSETTTETEMEAATSNDCSTSAHLLQVLCVDHGSAGDGRGSKGRFSTFAEDAGGNRENRSQPPGV